MIASQAPTAAKASVELVLSPTAPLNAAPGVAPGPVAAASSAAPSVATSVSTSDGFVQVRSFQPLAVPSASSFSFTLPADSFVHKDPQATVSVSAQLPQGEKLPDWLTFSAADKRFTGVAPQGVTKLDVIVKAVDPVGLEVSTVITLEFNKPLQ